MVSSLEKTSARVRSSVSIQAPLPYLVNAYPCLLHFVPHGTPAAVLAQVATLYQRTEVLLERIAATAGQALRTSGMIWTVLD